MGVKKKIVVSFVILFTTAVLIVGFKYITINDTNEYLKDTLAKTATSYFAARSLNALVSVVQSFEAEGSAVVVSGRVTVGELLDPFNDLVERFSFVMLVSSVSIGIQFFLQTTLPWVSYTFILPLSAMLFVISIWSTMKTRQSVSRFASKLLLLAVVLKITIPTMAITNEVIYKYALEERYESASQRFKDDSENLGVNSSEEGMFEKITKIKDQIGRKAVALFNKIPNITKYIVNLIICFVIQTMILPIVTLWLFFILIKFIFKRDKPFFIETYFENKLLVTQQ